MLLLIIGDNMKWKIKFILLLLLFVCGSVNASGSFSDYNGSINKANKYILDFDRYKLFIDSILLII